MFIAESRPLIQGTVASGSILAVMLLSGELTERQAGPEWPENQLAESGYTNIKVTRVATLFPESVGCEPVHAVGAQVEATDTRLGHRAVSGVVCLLPGWEFGQLMMDAGSERPSTDASPTRS